MKRYTYNEQRQNDLKKKHRVLLSFERLFEIWNLRKGIYLKNIAKRYYSNEYVYNFFNMEDNFQVKDFLYTLYFRHRINENPVLSLPYYTIFSLTYEEVS